MQNNSQKQNTNNQANFYRKKINWKCYRCGNSSHLDNSWKYINTICNLRNKRDHLGKVFECKSNNYQEQINTLNTGDIISVGYDKVTTAIKIPVLIENKAGDDWS